MRRVFPRRDRDESMIFYLGNTSDIRLEKVGAHKSAQLVSSHDLDGIMTKPSKTQMQTCSSRGHFSWFILLRSNLDFELLLPKISLFDRGKDNWLRSNCGQKVCGLLIYDSVIWHHINISSTDSLRDPKKEGSVALLDLLVTWISIIPGNGLQQCHDTSPTFSLMSISLHGD